MADPDSESLIDPPAPDAEGASRPARSRKSRSPEMSSKRSGGKGAARASGKSRNGLRRFSPLQWLRRWILRGLLAVIAFYAFFILLFSFVPPVYNIYQAQERLRLGQIDKSWVSWEEIAPAMGRSAVAAEDSSFCNHWGFDLKEIRRAIDSGSNRGASTISQQVTKNVFLWQGRSWLRKAMEAALTPVVELVWSKQRILEVYLNIAEFDEGVFGVEAAARHYFGVSARQLSDLQAARLAAILPDPKNRSASNPGNFVRKRTREIMDGAATIKADGRSRCFD